MQPIFLMGLPGCGKSTLGRALKAVGYSFADIDEAVEQRVGCSVAEFIGREGIDHFRQLEAEELRRLIDSGCADVIACGGGTPCHADNMELMNRSGLTVRLECRRDRLIRRIGEAGATRPMFAAIAADPEAIGHKVDEITAAREPFYSRAKLVFDSSLLENQEEIDGTVKIFIETVIK